MRHSILLLPTLALLLVYYYSLNNSSLQPGDFIFSSYNAQKNDFFSIVTLKPIQPNTKIQFTDAEWNGLNFSKDESNMLWESGNKLIPSGTEIHFFKTADKAQASHGTINKLIKISSDSEAIFAYVGDKRKPLRFIAAVSNSKKAYGTLANTQLIEGKSALTFPEGTYFFELKTEVNNRLVGRSLDNYKIKTKYEPVS